ncbi:MAG: CoA transferase [Candidatus Zixiibacteriota bacterium]|nr:MAG: CoA transferase [candidate division Zixibacteria bacterium]
MMKILDNIRVIDMTNVLSGPFCTLHLALLGAEVVKVEVPGSGDLARKLGNTPELNQQLMGTSFLAQNANKKSITLNLKKEEGKEVFRKLLKTADVVVENFRPGVMKRLGFAWEEMSKINPKLVYCAISGFGQTGPDAHKPAYDQIIQGLSGEMDINGDERLHPLRAGFPVCDTVGGLNAAFAVMSALYHREHTGEGQAIDIALLDSIMPLMGWVAANLLIGGKDPVPMGNDNFTAAPSGVFKTKDGFINIAANKQEQWEDLTDIVGLPELKTDDRFQERDTRKANRKLLTPILNEKLTENNTKFWVEALNSKGIPSGDILNLEKALTSDQIKHRETIVNIKEKEIGDLKLFNLSAKFSKTPANIDSPPPRLSAHTDEILGQLGYTEEDLKILKDKSVI